MGGSAIPDVLRAAREKVDAALERILPGTDVEPYRLHAAMRHSVMGGGKRVRPALALAACRAAGGGDDAATAPMAAVELLHTYTLIHDDLPAMDDDALRRGRPTCHVAFDEATAILAGDALQALAFAVLAPLGPTAVARFAELVGSRGVVGGQQLDLDAEGGPVDGGEACRARLEAIHTGKTAALIRAACELGGMAAGADAAGLAALGAYGLRIGLAFQIRDDILDRTATSEDLGKTGGKDAAAGKLTYLAVYGLAGARARAERLWEEARAALAHFGPDASDLEALGAFVVRRDR